MQIRVILAQLRITLNRICSDNFKITITEVNDNNPLAFYDHIPKTKAPDLSILESRESFIHSVCEEQRTLFISNIENFVKRGKKEIKSHKIRAKYYVYEDCVPKGSIIGIPIKNKQLNKLIFVITIKSDKPYIIDKKFKSKYNEFIEPFLNRIELESSLKELKDYASPKSI